MDDDFATMSTYEQLEYRTGQLEAQRQISKLLNVRAERAKDERDALRAEVARLQRLKAVAVDIANDREHNEKRLEAEITRLREAAQAFYDTFSVNDEGGSFVYWTTKSKHVDKFIDAFNLKE